MFRTRPLQTWFARLALVAALLMVCAPLVSRWLQSTGGGYAELCTAEGLKRVALAPPVMASMDSMDPAASHAGHAAPTQAAAAADHAAHGEGACDYCLLAMRLLPALLCLLALFTLPRASQAPLAPAAPLAAAFPWPAHPARGPPLYA